MLLSLFCVSIVFVFHLRVTSSIEGRDIKDFKDYQIVFPVRVSSDDKILESKKIDERYKRSSRGHDDIKHYKLKLQGNEETIDLRPNARLLAPAAIIEVRSHNKSDLSQLSDILIKQFSDKQCIYTGKVRNYEDSLTALSTCGGLYGLIRIKKHTYFIEPVEDKYLTNLSLQPHIIYEASNEKPFKPNCATKNNQHDTSKQKGDFLTPNIHLVKRNEDAERNRSKPLHLETMVTLDKPMMDLHSKNDLADYVLTVLNIAQSLLHELSVDPPINLELVRMIELEDENHKLNQRKKRTASEHLKSFSTWQNLVNPKSDNHPYHHDLALLLTGNNICNAQDKCNYLGVAETNGICDPYRQAAICKDNGLTLGYTIAHEIARTLGIVHDNVKGNQHSIEKNENETVMNPVISQNSQTWTPNSQQLFQSSLKGGFLSCLYDEQAPGLINPNDILPGIIYGRSFQCKRLFNENALQCNSKEDCVSLKCKFETTPCTNTGVPPAPGTTCGENKWCLDGECIELGKYPQPVHGGWSDWSGWSPCSRTCGAGVSTATRECNNPSPKHGGKICKGRKKRHKMCSVEICPKDSPSFRDAQCAAFNDWIFPEDGKTHQWKGFFIANGDPCNLFCENEENLVVSLQPKVKDGTSCNRGLRDVCVEGVCENIPCDLEFNSDSIEDGCGVCHGNGTTCEVQQGTKNFTTGVKKCLSAIPSGTKNIKLEMKNSVNSHFIIKSEEGDHLFNLGTNLGKFKVPGGIGWLGMSQPNQEILEIPGPISQPLTIWISTKEPQTVSYSMGLPSPLREGKYSWEYDGWLPCNAQCGDGVQYSEPKCFEKSSGLVENKYCESSEKPIIKRKPCNAGPCVARWDIGEWNECGPCPSDKAKRFRLVQCVKPIPGEEQGTVVAKNEDCSENRPSSSETCSCVNKRQAGFWPPRYQSHSPMKESRSLSAKKSGRVHEKRITLMQLENENEASMLKQFKENQFKHNPLMYIPTAFGRRLSITPKRKRRTAAFGDLAKIFQRQKVVETLNEDHSMKKSNDNILDNIATNPLKGQSKQNDEDEFKKIMQEELHDDGINKKPSMYNTSILETQNSNAFSTQKNNQDVRFSDSVFKLLQQNKHLNNPQEKKDVNLGDKSQESGLPFDLSFLNNPKNLDDLIHMMTLLKSLHYMNTSHSESNLEFHPIVAEDSKFNNFMKTTNPNLIRKDQYNNSFQKQENMLEQDKQSYLKANFLNSTSHLFDPKGDQNEKYAGSQTNFMMPPVTFDKDKEKETGRKDDFNNLIGNRFVVFPSDDKLLNRNKQQRTTNFTYNAGLQNDTNKYIVQKIISNLKFLDYKDKLKLYNDLCNITEALRGLLSLNPEMSNYPKNKLDSSMNLQKPLMSFNELQNTNTMLSNPCMFQTKKLPELNYQNNMKNPLQSNIFGLNKIQSNTSNECFDKFMQSMKTNFNPNKNKDQFLPELQKGDNMIGNKRKDTFYGSNIPMASSIKFNSKPVKRNYPNFWLTTMEPKTNFWQLKNLNGPTFDINQNVLDEPLTFSYKIPQDRICTTVQTTTARSEKCFVTSRLYRHVQPKNKLSNDFPEDETGFKNIQMMYPFGKRQIDLSKRFNRGEKNEKMYVIDLKKPESFLDLMDLINHDSQTDIRRPQQLFSGSKQGGCPPQIALNPKNETCVLLNELEEVLHRNYTGCYYIYREETTKLPECINTACTS